MHEIMSLVLSLPNKYTSHACTSCAEKREMIHIIIYGSSQLSSVSVSLVRECLWTAPQSVGNKGANINS